MAGNIYTLTDPRTGEIRYVGYTAVWLNDRLDPNHLKSITHKIIGLKH